MDIIADMNFELETEIDNLNCLDSKQVLKCFGIEKLDFDHVSAAIMKKFPFIQKNTYTRDITTNFKEITYINDDNKSQPRFMLQLMSDLIKLKLLKVQKPEDI